MALDPWAYAAKTRTEHAEQVALFMWANMAESFGWRAANDPKSYTVERYALDNWGFKGFGSRYCDIRGKSIPVLSPHALQQLTWLHAIHNQGHGDAIRGGKAKAEGVKAGVFDVFLPVPVVDKGFSEFGKIPPAPARPYYHGLYIELKRKDAGTPSVDQLVFQHDLRAVGYRAEICHGWELARDELLRYLGISQQEEPGT